MRRNTKAPTEAHRNQWESARNVKATIIQVNLLPYPGLGAIVALQSGVEPNANVYNITLCNFPACTCPHYNNMTSSAIGRRGMYVNCKHLYYVFRFLCKLDYKVDTFIHAPTLSMDEVTADSGSCRDNQDALVLCAMFCRGLHHDDYRMENDLQLVFRGETRSRIIAYYYELLQH